jgi:hypothetical protein
VVPGAPEDSGVLVTLSAAGTAGDATLSAAGDATLGAPGTADANAGTAGTSAHAHAEAQAGMRSSVMRGRTASR